MWHESVAKRGCNEIGSCLLKWIERKKKENENIKEFIFFSDNCSGQNRNRYIFALYLFISEKFNVKITHKFLEKGHTQNEADSIHALIERRKKGRTIFTPEQWIMLVKMAKTSGNPYDVTEMAQSDFKNLMSLITDEKGNWNLTEEKEKVVWLKVKQVRIVPELGKKIFIKYNHFDEHEHSIDIQHKIREDANLGRISISNVLTLLHFPSPKIN